MNSPYDLEPSKWGDLPNGDFATFGVVEVPTTHVAKPDALISPRNERNYIGEDVYNSTAAKQTASTFAFRGSTKKFFVRVDNDGEGRELFRVSGGNNPRGYSVRYFDGVTDVTPSVTSGQFEFNLDPGGSKSIRVEIKVRRSAVSGSSQRFKIVASSASEPARADAVKASVTVR